VSRLMTRDEVTAVYQAALERKKRERRYVREYTAAEKRQAWTEDRELPERGLHDPDWVTRSAADFWDDMIIRHGSPLGGGAFPESLVLVAVAAAARESAEAAVRALGAGRHLSPAAQAAVFENLRTWKAEPAAMQYGADRVVGQLLAEWDRLELAQLADEQQEAYRRAVARAVARAGAAS
jgi:hypothetical protein